MKRYQKIKAKELAEGKMRNFLISFVFLGAVACATTTEQNSGTSPADTAFEALMAAHWDYQLSQSPTFATTLGVRKYDDRLGDPSLEAYDASVAKMREFLAALDEIDPQSLSKENALNHALLKLDIENEIEAAGFGGKYMIISNREGPHLAMARMPDNLPFFTTADYESYVTRLGQVSTYMEKARARVQAGIEAGWVQPCAPMEGYEATFRTHIVDDVADSVFLRPFAKRPSQVPEADFTSLKSEAEGIISKDIIPAYRQMAAFYDASYKPACRANVGIGELPDGEEYYAHRARLFTTTDLTPDEIHELGLSEVKRIRSEMAAAIAEAEFDGTFAEWLDYLRTDPKFYPKTGEERMQLASRVAKKMDGELPKLFGHLPRTPYGLKEIPLDIAEKTTTAYYMQPSGDGTRAGFYFVNTTKLDTRPIHELEALTLHESVPGHHLQIAIAQELDMPPFRKFGGATAFVEGWGLYAERLGLEVGFYETPYTNFGRLSYEMWRACRLVVDTGMHVKGWTRQQAIDFMAENSGLSLNNITTEVDRYITWPGQALAYKIGELKIRELRGYAETELGADFDIREFHDRVLENGALPLSVLEGNIKTWVASKKAG